MVDQGDDGDDLFLINQGDEREDSFLINQGDEREDSFLIKYHQFSGVEAAMVVFGEKTLMQEVRKVGEDF